MMKCAVLHGEIPEKAGKDEQDVLVQTEAVSRALRQLGHTPVTLPVSMDFKKAVDALAEIHPDFVFNLAESIEGHGNLIHIVPSILDALNIPYTGANTEAVFMTSNKIVAKKIMDAKDMPIPPLFPADDRESLFMEGMYIIKAVWEHASVWLDENSILYAEDGNRLRMAISSQQKKLRMGCFAEPFIDGREFNLSLLAGDAGPEVLPPAEIQFRDYPPGKAKVVDYRSKWIEDSFEYRHTPRRFDFPEEDGPLLQQLTDLAIRCWDLFNLRGYARVDFRVDIKNYPWILEINTNPCLSPDGGFAAAVEQAEMPFSRAVERIIQDAMKFQY
jgi:D-alanine-D-alanine ligase